MTPRVPLHLPSPPLVDETLGLALRAWGTTPDDATALVAAWADPEVVRFTGVPRARDLDAAERWIAGEERRRTSGVAIDLVICELGRPEQVWGEVGLVVDEAGQRRAEIGYWTAPQVRRQGVATAAVTLVVAWVQRDLPVDRLVARTHPDNPASAAVAARAGFAAVGSLPDGTVAWSIGPVT